MQAAGSNFPEKILNAFNISITINEEDLNRIPADGPVVLIANHPFGGIEGIALAAILNRVRSDFKIMANHFLSIFPDLRDYFIFVDPFKTKGSAQKNISILKKTIHWVKDNRMLVLFPAGSVSHYAFGQGMITDPPWQENIERLITKVKAPVLPVFFEGSNRLIFQTLGLLHPLVRTFMLPKELINKQNFTLTMRVGNIIDVKHLEACNSPAERLAYLRRRTYNLANRADSRSSGQHAASQFQIVAAAKEKTILLDEIRSLPASQILFEQKNNLVFYAHAWQIPGLLHEIGREREITFRAVNEGSGKALDLDTFDEHYLHLVAWDKETVQIIGAYRFGLSDIIRGDFGKKGLYTHTLFKLKSRFFNRINPSIEMGRSFISSIYQRSFNSLYLLWWGIGEFIVRHPHYRYLFGPVSISNEYALASQQLIIKFLMEKHNHGELSHFVKSVNPVGNDLKNLKLIKHELKDIGELEEMISDIEGNLNGIPVLIKQYIKLGAQFIDFNRDPDFSDCLDGLIVVDLLKTNPKILGRYMGQEGALLYKQYHYMRGNLQAESVASAAYK